MTRTIEHFALSTPCDDCPFLKVGGIRLHRERAREILDATLTEGAGQIFSCHKTVHSVDVLDDEGDEQYDRDRTAYCAGALVLAQKLGVQNMPMQLGHRLGLFEPGKLHGHDRVFDTRAQMMKAQDR